MRKPRTGSSKARQLGLWLLAGLLETPLIRLWLDADPFVPLWSVPALHLGTAAAIFFAPPKAGGWTSLNRPWGLSSAMISALIPCVGWAIVGFMWFSAPAKEPEEFFQPHQDEVKSEETRLIDVQQEKIRLNKRLLDAVDVAPATDILLGQDPTMKRSAIETIAQMKSPEAVSWLIKARRDPHPDVRFFATTALTNLRQDYDQRIRAAQREVFERPMEGAPQISLFRITFEYAVSGLLDAETRHENLLSCRKGLEELAKKDDEALRLLYRVELNLDSNKAMAHLEELATRRPGERISMLKEKAKMLFNRGEYRALQDTLLTLQQSLSKPAKASAERRSNRRADEDQWKAAILWWTGE